MLFKRLLRSRRQALVLAYTLFTLVASAWLARSDSLFPVKQASQAQRGSSGAVASSLYSDARAHGVGDVLTVVIAEATTAQSSANLKTSQDESVNVNQGSGLLQRLFSNLTLSATNSRAADGSGETDRAGTLTTTLSVLVKEVLPNGTLRIEGSRFIGINRETQRVTFSGVVRPEDIAVDNSIQSNLIAEVEVHYDGKGNVGDTQRPGFLTRIFRFLF
jgi:flagellar L-ring protein precursor FlgH